MNKNLAILETSINKFNDDYITHMARLAAVKNSKGGILSEELKDLARRSGFICFIPVEKLEKFKYHANVRGDAYINGRYVNDNYVGDIPDFALNRIELAIQLGMSYITIHSAQPLSYGDPVIVGWFASPLRIGVLLAVWDNNLELETFGGNDEDK